MLLVASLITEASLLEPRAEVGIFEQIIQSETIINGWDVTYVYLKKTV